MTLLSNFQKNLTLPKIEQQERNKRYKDNQQRMFDERTETTTGIIDMSKQMEEVRKSNVTLPRNLVNGTTSRSYK